MKTRTKKAFAWVMTFAMLLSLLPAAGLTALAANDPVSYLSPVYKEDGKPASGLEKMETKSCTEFTEVTSADTEWKSGWYVVTGTVEIPNSVTCTGDVHLILTDDSSLTVTSSTAGDNLNAGICVSSGNSLTIYGQEQNSGTLTAKCEYETYGDAYGAGIGGSYSGDKESPASDSGAITINGGTVTAKSDDGGAGIGGGVEGSGNNITINGGEVTAKSDDSGAGIGGGYNKGSGSNITINGGTVTAKGGDNGAGIGGGKRGSGSNITINGGTVMATGGKEAAGIGGGYYGSGSKIAINGGTVTANGGNKYSTKYTCGDGIGNGSIKTTDTIAPTSEITIATSLTVKAGDCENPTGVIANDGTDLKDKLSGKQYATVTPPVSYRYPVYKQTTGTPYEQASSGIAEWKDGSVTNFTPVSSADTEWKSGWYVVNDEISITHSVTCTGDVHLILTDGSSLTVTSSTADDNLNAGICVSSGNSLTIYGQEQNSGTLTAKCETTGDSYGAGIGSSLDADYQGIDSGAITINGGIVTAISTKNGAGIGGGFGGSGNNITINGGAVTANGGRDGAGIGGGSGGSGSNITINGGEVTANGGDYGAGIGGGHNGSGSYITINGGEVTATGTGGGAGIGGGVDGSGNDITINGGELTATGNSNDDGVYGVGIGGGNYGSGNNIFIATTLTVKADTKTPPETVIENTGDDLADSLKEKQYVKVEKGADHTHNFTSYSADGATLSATCSADGCPLTDSKVSLTLTAPALTEYGGEESAEATLSDTKAWTDAGLTVPDIAYYSGKTKLDAAPANAGSYTAKITAGGETASLGYTIAKAEVEVPTAESFTYDGDEKTALTIAEDALYELDSTIEGGKIKATDAGDYSFCVKLKDTDNYEWNSKTPDQPQQVTWSIAKATVEVPEAVTGLVYNGTEQTGVSAGDLYGIENNTEIAAGNYTALATLSDSTNYKWSTGDEENATRDIPWSIGKLAVTLWSETASKEYDGTALTAPTVYADSNKKEVDSVFAGEVTELAATGSVTYVSQGEMTNEITYTFKEGCSEDNYSITKNEGKLIITQAGTMKITGSDYTGFYDGKAHGEAATPTVTEGTTVTYSTDSGMTWSETVPQITDAGTLYVKAKAENPNYTDATCDYTLTVNQFTENTITGLTCEKVKKGETPAPTATAKFGEITYSYAKVGSTSWDTWENTYDGESGDYQVKAVVAETANYNGCESENAVTFRVGYVCEGWKIVKFDELNPGQYKMYLNNTDTGVYNFAMVVGGYTIQDVETGKYICLTSCGEIVLCDTCPTVWAKGIASFHASPVSTGDPFLCARYYLNVDCRGNLVASVHPGITHFASHIEADEHDYCIHGNGNGTHTHTCIVCGDSYEETCTPNRWNFCTECGGYVKSGSSWWNR